MFVGCAIAVVAFPMLARIIQDSGLAGTRLGTVALSCAAIDDAIARILLALVVATVGDNPFSIVVAVGGIIVYVLVMVGPVRLACARLPRRADRGGSPREALGLATILVILGASFTDAIGVYSVFGAFLAGAVILLTVMTIVTTLATSPLYLWARRHWPDVARHGIEATVVERAEGQRSSGSPVDVRGPALAVVEQMGVLGPLRAAATLVTTLAVVDGWGGRIGAIPTQTGDGLEVPRRDLVAILLGAASGHAEFVYGDTVLDLHDDGHGVDVTFDRAAPRRFDLVVGADGLHSAVRRLTFGPGSRFTTHLGLYIATTFLDHFPADRHTVVMHNAPGRAVAVHPTTGREGAAFIFRHPLMSVLDERQLIVNTYAGMGWRVPELLERVRDCEDLYFDAVSRVRLDTWSRGRTTLVGDAANCVSLLGEGSSMAIAGAVTLVQALVAEPASPAEALRRYERAHRRRLARVQRGIAATSHMLVPATRTGVTVRNAAFRVLATATR